MRGRGRKNPAAAGQKGGYLRLSEAKSQRPIDCTELAAPDAAAG
jgi:hypothetical protein